MWLMYVLWPVFVVASAMLAHRRGRSGLGWFVLGVLFGPLAVIAVLLLPDLVSAESRPAGEERKEGISPGVEGPEP